MKYNLYQADRNPAVAGQFYASQPEKLEQEVLKSFNMATPHKYNHVRAIICPHAGFVYSGKIAASAFNQIDGNAHYERVFLIASSHREYFDKASVYCQGNYIMPYGNENVDQEFGRQLVEHFPDVFTANSSPHISEHSVEVQLPFLHHVLKSDYKIVPIIIGTNKPEICYQIGNALKSYLNEKNLFIISSDFSHYPEYTDAIRIDNLTKTAILSNNPDVLLRTLNENKKRHIPNLVTSLCGWTSVLTLLYMTHQNNLLEYHAVDYCNSGDAILMEENDRVVGYWGIAVSEKQMQQLEGELTEMDKNTLLYLARKTLDEYSKLGTKHKVDATKFSSILNSQCGVFVTLHKYNELRGCIGLITTDQPLYKSVQEMTISAAAHDYRFKAVDQDELSDIEIEISVLSPMTEIKDIAEITLGKHGIYLKKGNKTGLFLPQVATETGWSKEDFLGHCAHDKAGMEWDGWKTADIYTFSATVFGEKL